MDIVLSLDYEESDKLLESAVKYMPKYKAYQHLSNFLSEDDDLVLRINKNNYYGNEDIKHLVVAYYLMNHNVYEIQDTDSHTNLRKAPGSNSEIITQLKTGTTVMSLSTEGNWWHIITYGEGMVGYVHKSRLKLKTPAGVL